MRAIILIFSAAMVMLHSNKLASQEYFQQDVNYKIEVKLDDQKHELHAFEELEYTNNSPNELSFIYFHIWPNAYSDNSTALAQEKIRNVGKHHLFNMESQKGFIDSLNFKVNGQAAEFEINKENLDICKLILPKPINSGETIKITTPFHVKIPKAITSRLGHMKQAYKITQWYPKPAVYDKDGWHQFPYYDMGEFYSEFGSFDVSITIPKNYVVAATGNLQTESEIKWLEERVKQTEAVEEFKKDSMNFPKSSKELKTIRYTENNIHDFAWFADKRYHVLKSSVKLPNSGREVSTWVYFRNNDAKKWLKANSYINDALHYYSLWYGDYPFDNCSAILNPEGARGGGMEYPTITAIGKMPSDMSLEMVIMHEVGHNWFYGILGFNEREHPWLDEGINSFSDLRYMQTKYDSSDNTLANMAGQKMLGKLAGLDHLQYKHFNKVSYLFEARANNDQAANLHTDDFTGSNYGNIVYRKTAHAFYYLMHYLGEDKFNEIMQKFYEDWKFKHPQPEDVKRAFQDATEEDISWFFEDLIESTKKVDYKVKRLKDNKLLVKNKGNMGVPFPVSGISNNNQVYIKWYKGIENKEWIELPNKEVDMYAIDYNDVTLDLYSGNDNIKAKGVLKKVEPLKLKLAGPINIPDYTQINYLPVVGWNNYNKTMLGIYFHNGLAPANKVTVDAMPLYGLGNNDIAGNGNITFSFYPSSNSIHHIKVKFHGLHYAYNQDDGRSFSKLAQTTDIGFLKEHPKSRKSNNIVFNTTYATDIFEIASLDDSPDFKIFNSVSFNHRNSQRINPYGFNASLEGSDDFVKSSFVGNYKLSYYKSRGLDIRLFAGTFLYKDGQIGQNYYYHLSGSSGMEDYKYDNMFLGRFENPIDNSRDKYLSQQFVKDQGGFVSYTPIGVTKDWLATINLTSDLPNKVKFPVRLYGNLGYFGGAIPNSGFQYDDHFVYETGACLYFGNAIKFYFPALVSDEMNDFIDSYTNNYWERIRFSINFNQFSVRNMF